jgi:ABC-type dipeptide/oligopeptide/nickel transport system permease component
MGKFIAHRLLLLIPTLFGIITMVFFMVELAPGDPARVMLGERASAEDLEELRTSLGYDKSPLERYGIYLGNIITLNFGRSIKSNQPVINEIMARFPATVELSISAMLFASVVGVFVGIWAAKKKNTLLDYGSMAGSLVGVSMPVFWLALVLIMVFSVALDWFPTGSRMPSRVIFEPITGFYILDSIIVLFSTGNARFLGYAITHLVLPTLALGTIPLAIIARTTRSAMLDVLKQDYIKTARAAGISEQKILYSYALKNALLPVITVIGLQFGLLLSGAVLTETIFAWPGIGIWLFDAIEARDFPAVQGGIIFVATAFILINLLVDVLYSLINPKIRVH